MNKHFEDTRYYLKRAVETATKGVREEVEPLETRFREMSGRDDEPDPSRLDELRGDLKRLEERAEGEAREAIENAREQIRKYRQRDEEATA